MAVAPAKTARATQTRADRLWLNITATARGLLCWRRFGLRKTESLSEDWHEVAAGYLTPDEARHLRMETGMERAPGDDGACASALAADAHELVEAAKQFRGVRLTCESSEVCLAFVHQMWVAEGAALRWPQVPLSSVRLSTAEPSARNGLFYQALSKQLQAGLQLQLWCLPITGSALRPKSTECGSLEVSEFRGTLNEMADTTHQETEIQFRPLAETSVQFNADIRRSPQAVHGFEWDMCRKPVLHVWVVARVLAQNVTLRALSSRRNEAPLTWKLEAREHPHLLKLHTDFFGTSIHSMQHASVFRAPGRMLQAVC